MNGNTDDERSPAERDALASLDREIDPPAALLGRTVAARPAEGLLPEHGSPGRAAWLRPAWGALGAVLALGIGLAVGWWTAAPAGGAESPDFILILRAGPEELAPEGEEEMMRRVGEYTAWAQAAGERGSLITGEKLRDGGRLLEPTGDRVETASLPLDPTRGSIQGYFLIRSRTYEEAQQVAGECPHLRYGGAIELRRIERFEEAS